VLEQRSADEEAQKKFREESTAELGRESQWEKENVAFIATVRPKATALGQGRSADTATSSQGLQSLENHMTEQRKHVGQGHETETRDQKASAARTETLCLELSKVDDTDRATLKQWSYRVTRTVGSWLPVKVQARVMRLFQLELGDADVW